MNIELKFAELHIPLFLAGINFGTKLDTVKRPIKLIYDRKEKEMIIFHNGIVGIIPASNLATMTPVNPAELIQLYGLDQVKQPAPVQAATPTRGRPKAQVSTPTSHVFETPV